MSLETNERKNIALWMMFGGAFVFTSYAFIGLYLVKNVAGFVFWLAVIAHIQVFSIMAGFIAQLVKRRISAGKGGVTITDEGIQVDLSEEARTQGIRVEQKPVDNPAGTQTNVQVGTPVVPQQEVVVDDSQQSGRSY